jgi:hypothetical protein
LRGAAADMFIPYGCWLTHGYVDRLTVVEELHGLAVLDE